MIFIDSQVVADDGMGILVSGLFIWIAEEGDVVSCVTAGAALAAFGARTKSDGCRVTPGITPGRVRGGRPAERNTNKRLLTTAYMPQVITFLNHKSHQMLHDFPGDYIPVMLSATNVKD